MRSRIVLTVVMLLLALCWGAAGVQAAGSGNLRNDKLLALPKNRQAQVLANSFRRRCVGVRAFPMGVTATGRAKGTAYWSLGCKNGHSYVVQIPPNVKEPAVIVDCRVLEGTGKACFQKF